MFGIQYSTHFQNTNIFGIRCIFTFRDNPGDHDDGSPGTDHGDGSSAAR